MKSKYTKELLAPIVAANVSMAGVLRNLGLHLASGNYTHLKKVFKSLSIDTSHFLGQGTNRGINHKGGPAPTNLLILRNETDTRTNGQRLRKALLKVGRLDVCEKCGQKPEWQGKSLILTPDHKNGKFWDNRPENLELLCPNCHSQTETFGARNRV
jgi:hypothetical protein